MLWNYKNNPVTLHLGRQRPRSFIDLHFLLWDGLKKNKLHKPINSGSAMKPAGLGWDLLPLSICRLICSLCTGETGRACGWTHWGLAALGTSQQNHGLARILPCQAPPATTGYMVNQPTAWISNEISSQLLRIPHPNPGTTWILAITHTVPAQRNVLFQVLAQEKPKDPNAHRSLPHDSLTLVKFHPQWYSEKANNKARIIIRS